MKHFTNQDSLAIKDIELALSIKYNDIDVDSTQNAGFNLYLDGILIELKSKIKGTK